MDCAKVGNLIHRLRIEKNMTQKKLADLMNLSDKTVSKWERGLGCPDVSLLAELSEILGINIEEMLTGELSPNTFVGGNMKKAKYYVCQTCGNITCCTGEAAVSCCSRKLEALDMKKAADEEALTVEQIEDDWYVTSNHPMDKAHYISFVVYATGDKIQMFKQYPEWNLQLRIPKREHGLLLWYCVKDGLYYQNI